MNRSRGTMVAAILLIVLARTVDAQSSAAASCLANLHGTWRGPGTILGRPVVMEQRWQPALRGAFTEMSMQHFVSDTSTVPQFEGRGFYRSRTGSDSVSGSWLDARGLTLVVSGSCRDGSFSSHWSGAENGRTVYALRGDELSVIDSIRPASGPAREFGRSLLRRVRPG